MLPTSVTFQGVDALILVSAGIRFAAAFVGAIAVHDVIRNGICVVNIPKWMKIVLYSVVATLAASVIASLLRLQGAVDAAVIREITYFMTSLSILAVSLVIVFAHTSNDKKMTLTQEEKRESWHEDYPSLRNGIPLRVEEYHH